MSNKVAPAVVPPATPSPVVPAPSPLPLETIKRFLPWLVAVAFFMQSLDTTILNTAVPAIAGALGIAPLNMKAVLSSYTLSLAVFIPISGWVADRFGTRRVFAWAIGTFTLGSVLCGVSNSIHVLVASRVLQGLGGAMMVPVGRLTLVRTFPKSELVRAMSFVAIPSMVGPMLGPVAGGFIVGYFHWRGIFLINLPVGLLGLALVLRYLPDYREAKSTPLDLPGLILFGTGIGLLAYVLEIFGEHTLSGLMMAGLLVVSALCLTAYGLRAARIEFPLLRLKLFAIRTFRVSVSGSFFTRLGVGGIPFLFPLLYQVGLGFTPIQSGLLIMPQALAALSLKFLLRKILKRFGYRRVLVTNTLMLGLMILSFTTVGAGTPVWLIVVQAFCFGTFTSLQYSSMNTLVYADVRADQTSGASAITSTVQQMSISFGIAVASLLTALFVPDRYHTSAPQMIHGIHLALLILGGWTIFSALIFRELKKDDGHTLSLHKALQHAGS
ncbi:MAG TPA: DHA2 family efflux MFS transporter permease subunit [Verrucomicrobiae bacterium]|nr:DHA2 family efflux MFS transporter permease subunit [Verrucomicrobiae bacterium]